MDYKSKYLIIFDYDGVIVDSLDTNLKIAARACPVSFHENSLGIKRLRQADVIRDSSYFVKNACIGYLISTDTHMIYSNRIQSVSTEID